MSLIALAMNGFLAVLLMAALGMGWSLEKRLKALRASHEGFAKAVGDLDAAALKAERGLADLRAATDEAAETLAERIESARRLAMRLDNAVAAASTIEPAPRSAPAPRPAVDRAQTFREMIEQPRQKPTGGFDDDLFEGPGLRAISGGRR